MAKLSAAAVVAAILLVALGGCDLFASAQTRVTRARELMAQWQHSAALIELKNVLQAQPDHVEARLLLAEASLWLGDAAAAEKELRRAADAGARPEATSGLTAQTLLALGRGGELLEQLEQGKLVLSRVQQLLYRGRALLALQRPQEAEVAFKQATEIAPSVDARVGLADSYAAQGRAEEALAELDALLEAEPGEVHALQARGTLLARRGQFERGERDLKAAAAQAERLALRARFTLLATLTETQLGRGDIPAARNTHSQLRKLVGDAPLAVLLGARIAAAEQNYSQAAGDLQRVVSAAPDFVPARLLLGAALLAQGNVHQAEVHLREAVQRAPENLEARKLLAQVQLRMERPDAAVSVLLPVTQAEEGDGGIDALLGLAHLQLGHETKGRELLERAVADNPADRGLKIELASAYLRSGENDRAMQLLRSIEHVPSDIRRERMLIAAAARTSHAAARAETESLLRSYPRASGVLNLAAAFFAGQGEFDRARVLLERAADAQPGDANTLINRARVEIAAGEPAAAGGWLERALQADPKNTAAHMLLAELAMRRNDASAAAKWLERARGQNAQAIEPRLQLARLHLRERRAREADEVLKELASVAGGRADVLNAMGLIDLEGGRHPEALARFRAASELAPDNPAYWLNIARAQLALNDGAIAREALSKALQLRPDWLPAVNALALLDVRDGKAQSALARVQALKSRETNNPAVHALAGDVHLALKQYREAAQAFEKAFSLAPSSALALRAYQARQLGKLGDAVVPLETWIAQRPDDFRVRLVLADAYRVAGQRARAIEHYEVVVRNGPANVAALNNLAWLYHEAGDARAEVIAKRAYERAPNTPAVADTYGWILVQSGRAAEGLDILKGALSSAPQAADIEYHYAAALAATGSVAQARARLQALLEQSRPFAERAAAERLLQQLSSL